MNDETGKLRDELAEVIELALDAGAWDYGSETKLAWIDRLEELTGTRWEDDKAEFDDWEPDDSFIHFRG